MVLQQVVAYLCRVSDHDQHGAMHHCTDAHYGRGRQSEGLAAIAAV